MGLGKTLIIVAGLLVCIPLIASANVTDDETVVFQVPAAPLTKFQKQRLPQGSQNPRGPKITARLRMPQKTGRMPAIVIVHSCHNPAFYLPWIKRLNSWGLATLSFSRCQPPDFQPIDNKVPSLDWKGGAVAAYAALQYLTGHQKIDSSKVALITWSRLGMISLSVFNYEGNYPFFNERFAAAVAFYPFCSFARGPHAGPILVLSAGQDDWVDPTVCERMSRLTRNDDHPIKIKVYKDAWHGFDIEAFGAPHFLEKEINPDGFAVGGGTLGFNQPAYDDAIVELRSFLKRYLGF